MIKIAHILKLRDDVDIVPYNLIYHYNIGVRDFYIMFHMPTDELIECVCKTQNNLFDAKFTFLYHDKEGKGLNPKNADYLKVLTDRAQKDGFKWIIGTDADEFLILRKYNNIYNLISQYDNYKKVSLIFKWTNYYAQKDELEDKFYLEMQYRNDYMPWTKAIGKFGQNMSYVQGLHHIGDMKYGQVSADIKVINISPDIAYYAHFPYRSKEQFIDKNIKQSQKFNDWRLQRYKNDPLYFEKAWRKMIDERIWPTNMDHEENIQKGTKELIFDPVNPKLMELE